MNPARLQAFAEAYAPAVMQAHLNLGPSMYKESPAEYALSATMGMLSALERAGVEGIAGYVLNTKGGALAMACQVLGFEYTVRALEDYLDGK